MPPTGPAFPTSPRQASDRNATAVGSVTLLSEDPAIEVTGVLIQPASAAFPQPKYETIDRFGFFGLEKYAGQDPHELTLKIRFENGGRSLEGEAGAIRRLERLAERVDGRDAPPDVEVDGPVPHSTLRWRVTGLVEDLDRTIYNASGDRTRLVVTVTLKQRVTDTVLGNSLSTSKKAKGVGSTTRVQQGEDSLYDVAQRYYHNSSMAIAISRANPVKGNPMPLGTKLRVNQRLVMP